MPDQDQEADQEDLAASVGLEALAAFQPTLAATHPYQGRELVPEVADLVFQ